MHSHTPPIIHGDIKPTNLKLTEENHIVLLDHALGGGQNLLPEGERKFGPYASPEQARGIPLSSASDIYSFSATFYNLMTNVVPPGARKRADAIRSGLPDPLVSLSKANPEISADIAQVMERGLEVSADKRFAVAIEMQKALRRAYKKAKEGTTAQTVEFKRSDEPTVEMQGQANVIEADAVTVTNDVAPETAELTTRTHIVGPGAEPTIELGAADIVPDPIAADIKTEMLPVAVTGAAPEPVTPAVRPAARPPAKRSRAGLFIGGLLALLVLAGMGLGGGWYFYNNYYKTAVVTPSATPLPSPVISPSPTPETVVASDSNINTNSNSVSADTNSNDDNPGKVTVGTTIPTTGKPPQTPARTVAVRTPQPPKTRPSAKPKAGDDRTVILQ